MKRLKEKMRKALLSCLSILLTVQLVPVDVLAKESEGVTEIEVTEDTGSEEVADVEIAEDVVPKRITAMGTAGEPDPEEITTWAGLQTAINAGGTITLTQDIVAGENDTYLSVPTQKEVVIDLNGYRIDRGLAAKDAAENGFVIGLETGKSAKPTTLTIKDGSEARTGMITGGNNSGSGGGVYVRDYASFILESGSVSGNSAANGGGGIYTGGGSTASFTMKGGAVTGNHTSSTGGGVEVYRGSFTMEAGIVNNNLSGSHGGGVYVGSNSAGFTMNGGTICNNASTVYGGGVYNYKTFTMNGGTICNNASTDDGGGVYNYKSFTMNGGTICGNSSDNDGGGVYIYSSNPFEMKGGSILDNTCGSNKNGGGVYFYSNQNPFSLSGRVMVSGNRKNGGTAENNVYQAGQTSYIRIAGGIEEGSSVGVTTIYPPNDTVTRTFTSGLKENNNGGFSAFFSDLGYGVKLTEDGNEACLFKKSPHAISINAVPNGSISSSKEQASAGETVIVTFQPEKGFSTSGVSANYIAGQGESAALVLTKLSDTRYSFIMPDAEVTINAVFTPGEWKELELLLNHGGEVKLQKDYTARENDSFLSIESGTVLTLDLNGHRIDRGLADNSAKSGGHVIKVLGSLTVTDTSEGGRGEITGGNSSTIGGGIFVASGGSLTLNAGSIRRNKAGNNGGGVYVDKGAFFTMNGGSICDNSVEGNHGGGIHNNGTLALKGGEIKGNTAKLQGGGVRNSGAFTMTGGDICDNSAGTGGGGVYDSGSFKLTGGSIKNNAAAEHGGGIYLDGTDNGLQGRIEVTGNRAGEAAENLRLSKNQVIKITGIVDPASLVGVSTETLPSGDAPVTITSGLEINGYDCGFLKSDNEAYCVMRKNREAALALSGSDAEYEIWISPDPENGTVEADTLTAKAGDTVTLTAAPATGYRVSGMEVQYKDTDGNIKTAVLSETSDKNVYTFTMPPSSVTVKATFEIDFTWGDLNDLLAEGGRITLMQDVRAQSGDTCLTVPDGVSATLDLNGCSIHSGDLNDAVKSAFSVKGELTIIDSSLRQTGVIQDKSALPSYGRTGILVEEGGKLILKGGMIKSFSNSGVRAMKGSVFTLEGGSIIQNGTGTSGGGVYVDGALFSMSGGSIRENSAHDTGAGVCMSDRSGNSLLSLSGGEIAENKNSNIYQGGAGISFLSENHLYAADFHVMGSPRVSDNIYEANISLNGTVIKVTGELRNAVLRISRSDTVKQGVIAEGLGHTMTKSDYSAFKLISDYYILAFEEDTVKAKLNLTSDLIESIEPQVFTGDPLCPGITVRDKTGDVLTEGVDYTVTYSNNINAGEDSAQVRIGGKGFFTGNCSRNFTISKGADRTLGDVGRSVNKNAGSLSWDLSPIVPQDEGNVESFSIDGSISCSGAVHVTDSELNSAGELKISFEGGVAGDRITIPVRVTAGNYDSTVKVCFTLSNLEDPAYAVPEALDLTYNGKLQELVKEGSVTKGGEIQYSESPEGGFSTEIPAKKDAGDYTVYYRITETSEVSGTEPFPIRVSIKRKQVNIRANYPSKPVNAPDPELTAVVEGLVEGEPESLISYTVFRKPGEQPGFYSIYVAAEEIQGNYSVRNQDGTFEIVECPHEHRETRDYVGATCVSEGYSGDIYCTDCGNIVQWGEKLPVDRDAHSYDSGMVTKQATIFTEGIRTYICTRCHHTYTETIPRVDDGEDHSDLIADVTDDSGNIRAEAGTMTGDDGSTETIVTVGGEEVSKNVTDPVSGKETVETKVWIGGLKSSYEYTGSAIKPDFHVYDGTKKLTSGKDYSVSYKNNKNAGATATITISFKGSYKGTSVVKLNFDIISRAPEAKDEKHKLSKASVKLTKRTYDYTGEEIIPAADTYTLKLNGKTLKEGEDFTVSVTNNVGIGTATIIFSAKEGNTEGYGGTKTATFRITGKKELKEGEGFTCSYSASVPYAKGGAKPSVVVKDGDDTLKAGTDYTISYSKNTKVTNGATAVITINGKGNYKGSIKKYFTITAQELSKLKADIFTEDKVISNKGYENPKVTITDLDGKKLKAGTDFEIDKNSYSGPDTNGVVTATVKGKDSYTGTESITYRYIESAGQLSKTKVKKSIAKKTYTGSEIRLTNADLTEILYTGSKASPVYLIPGKDFEVLSHTNNTKPGTAKVTVKGTGSYGGTKTLSFKITAKKGDYQGALIGGGWER